MPSSFEVPPLSWKLVESKANKTLSILAPECLESPMPTPIIKILEISLYEHFKISCGVAILPLGIEAQFDPINNEIILQESVYEDLHNGKPRASFTCAHEAGHVILHAAFLKEIASGERQALKVNRGTILPYKNPEKQADRFASEFLMPSSMVEKMIKKGACVEDIMDTFKVSFTAAKIKFDNISKN